MKFDTPIVEAYFLKRYKRFFAEFEVADGTIVTAHCANPGSMRSCLRVGAKSWLTTSDNPKRKLRYTWQVTELDGVRVFVNPMLANDVVVDGIRSGVVSELTDYSVLQREVRIGDNSRVDIVLSGPAPTCYIEVKNVTLGLEPGRSAFPDSVTARGTKHLRELMSIKRQGMRAVLFFCVSRQDASSVEPADDIDPEYGRTLREAINAGVEVLAYRCRIEQHGIELDRPVAVRLP